MPSTGTNYGEVDVLSATPVVVSGGNKADSMIWDAYKVIDPQLQPTAQLDGGAGNDSFTLRVTQAQLDSLMAEIGATQPGVKIKPDGTLIGDGSTFSGNNWVHLDTLNIDVKNWENVKIQVAHLGSELVQNWNFEAQAGSIADGGFLQTSNVTGWQNFGGSLELTSTNYTGNQNTGPMAGSNEKVWLDASASPGDIHLKTVADVSTGGTAQLTVSVAMQDILYNGEHYTPDADDHFMIVYDGHIIFDFDKADFAGKNANEFYEFTANVTGSINHEALELISTGNTDHVDADGHHGYASFALDHVSLKEWIV
jgi:hypothetical protein